jgi:hypothetical protein
MNKWKVAAIIVICLLILENSFIYWGYSLNKKEQERQTMCYYNVCQDYPQAILDPDTNVCSCYDYDLLGNINYERSVKSEYLK